MFLEKNKKYTRKEVHDIFEPNTNFQIGCGAWGLRGIVRIKKTKDYVFFVTYGSEQAGYKFEEGIDKNGILIWQSQPSQSFDSSDIKNFINHDEKVNNIYLFKRNNKAEKQYVYLGTLKYLNHIKDKVKPVWFKWQIMDWNNDEKYDLNRTNPNILEEKKENKKENCNDLDKIIELYRERKDKESLIILFEATYKRLIQSGFSIEDLFDLL